jgi:hypothetical protein
LKVRLGEGVDDEAHLEETLKFGFGAAELVQRLREDGVASSGSVRTRARPSTTAVRALLIGSSVDDFARS